MKVTVDPVLCAGCGICEDICPAVFIVHGGVAIVEFDPIPSSYQEPCRRAAKDCPVEAIDIEE